MIKEFKIISKKEIAPKIYEITFETKESFTIKPWQFITFLLPKLGWRAYSILEQNWNKTILIIKKWEIEDWWRWGSKYICEKNIGDILQAVWPAGHFLLKENNNDKLFIWTWTWFVPLYNMILGAIEKKLNCNLFLTFWVRTRKDLFYIDKLREIRDNNPNFKFAIYISREKDILDFELENSDIIINSWYTTNFLTPYNISKFKEIYICWAPSMIQSTQKKLDKIWFDKENIFFEKY